MPYKDPEAKRQWELKHRTERLERRRELRRIQAAQLNQHMNHSAEGSVLLLPVSTVRNLPAGLTRRYPIRLNSSEQLL